MSNPPNVINSTIFRKYSYGVTLGTSNVNHLVAGNNYSYIINSLIVHNYDTTQRTVSCTLTSGNGVTLSLANAMAIPAKSTLVLISKENPVYLYYNTVSIYEMRSIGAHASLGSTVNAFYSIEYYTDT